MIREEILLPELNVGDLVVGKMMGAYTWASASTFNFFPKANVIVMDTDIKEPNKQELDEAYEYATSSVQEIEQEQQQQPSLSFN